jgi:GAF domain-containing protein
VEYDQLAVSLYGLSSLLTGQRPLREMLADVAEFATQAIPGADGAGLTMLEDDRPQTVVATAEFVRLIDDIQYGLDEGPCLLAVETGRTQVSGSLGRERRWPRFGPRVGRMGVHSVLSLPLLLPEKVVGVLNIYAHTRNAFDPDAVRIGELFALPAAVSVHNARLLLQSQRLAGQLTDALSTRAVIDQAIGILISRTGAGPAEAIDRLGTLSRDQSTTIDDVSQQLVDDAIRPAS